MFCQHNYLLTQWLVDAMIDQQIVGWHNVWLTQCLVATMFGRHNVWSTQYLVNTKFNWHNVWLTQGLASTAITSSFGRQSIGRQVFFNAVPTKWLSDKWFSTERRGARPPSNLSSFLFGGLNNFFQQCLHQLRLGCFERKNHWQFLPLGGSTDCHSVSRMVFTLA
jgi:hypothetical protein